MNMDIKYANTDDKNINDVLEKYIILNKHEYLKLNTIKDELSHIDSYKWKLIRNTCPRCSCLIRYKIKTKNSNSTNDISTAF